MGIHRSKEADRNAFVTRALIRDQKKGKDKIKVLLLGTGDSGKSTIFRQARCLMGNGFSEGDVISFKPIILENIISQIQLIIRVNQERFQYEFDSQENKKNAEDLLGFLRGTGRGVNITPATGNKIKAVWKDNAIKNTWKRRSEFQVYDTMEYFFQDSVIDKITRDCKNYRPNEDDMIQCRFRTTGIESEEYVFENVKFEMFDVGGQRSERRKWIPCFNNVDTILFVTAISEYDQFLYEDENVQRLEEAFRVWIDIVNRDDFKNIAFVLFLNKMDLFRRKLTEFPFKLTASESKDPKAVRNEDYRGLDPMNCPKERQEDAVKQCAEFVRSKFLRSVNHAKRNGLISTHFTIATDGEAFNVIFKVCVTQILSVMLDSIHGTHHLDESL